MDIGTVVSWIQAGIWVLALILWLGRLLRGEIQMHPLAKRAFSSNGLIGLVVVAGLIMSAISLYFSYTAKAIPKQLTLNISVYDPPYPAPMQVVSDQKFEDQDIPLDGYVYERCTFKNTCFLYDGGAFGLHNSTVIDHWKVCVRDQRLKNHSQLMDELKLMIRPSTNKTTVVPR